MIIADIYLSFNAFFVQRVPRASAEVENLTDEGSQTLLRLAQAKLCVSLGAYRGEAVI